MKQVLVSFVMLSSAVYAQEVYYEQFGQETSRVENTKKLNVYISGGTQTGEYEDGGCAEEGSKNTNLEEMG